MSTVSPPPPGDTRRAGQIQRAPPPGRGDLLAALAHLLVALLLFRNALSLDRFPGVSLGEGWGRLFVTAQVRRWLDGDAPFGQADLLAWPGGMSFWPTDPLVQVIQAPLSGPLGDTLALTLVSIAMLTLAGVGPHLLARTLGARPLAAAAAGVVVQLCPFVLRHGADLVLEALAIGPATIAAAAIAHALAAKVLRVPHLLGVGLGVLGCAATSPYYAIYLALVCGIWAVATRASRRRWRRWLWIAAFGAIACGLAILPLLLTESGPHGRLGPAFSGQGYAVTPTRVVRPSGRPVPRRQGRMPSPRPEQAQQRQDAMSHLAQRIPGGATLLLLTLVGLCWARTRRLALLALLLLLLGPEPWLAAARIVPHFPRQQGPLAALFSVAPITRSLGNAGRLVAAFAVLAALVGARLATRWPALAPVLVLCAGLEARARYRGLALPSTQIAVPAGVLDSLSGPTVFFPSGDPPMWHPQVAPKETLFLAGRAGVPVAYDYGRTRQPADLAVQVRLSRVADTPVGVSALRTSPALPDDAAAWSKLPFSNILVLGDRLEAGESEALSAWLSKHATLRLQRGDWSVWSWPDRF